MKEGHQEKIRSGEADDVDKEKVDDDKNEQNENLSITKQDNGQSLLFQFCPDPYEYIHLSLSCFQLRITSKKLLRIRIRIRIQILNGNHLFRVLFIYMIKE